MRHPHACCFVVVISLVMLCISPPAHAINVLLLVDCDSGYDDGSQWEVQHGLAREGLSVTMGPAYYEWDGITPDVNDFDVVVYLEGVYYGYTMTPQAETALAAFVAGGGGLVLTESAAYSAYHGFNSPVIADLLPVVAPASATGESPTWQVTAPAHALTSGLPASWYDYDAEYTMVVPKPSATVVAQTTAGNPMLSYRTDLGGTVVHVNHSLRYGEEMFHPSVHRVFFNAVVFAGDLNNVDCDGNGTPDYIQIATDPSIDTNRNGHPDACDPDCNANGLPNDVDIDAALFQTVPYQFGTVDLDWASSCDWCQSGTVALPFPLQLGGEAIVAFDQCSTGYVELLRAGESAFYAYYGIVTDLIHHAAYPGDEHSYLMVAYGILDPSFGGTMGYQVEPTYVRFYWLTETYCDDDDGIYNRFEMILHADGQVRWNFDYANYTCEFYDLFTGVYMGYDRQQLVEVRRGFIPEQQSWIFHEDGVVGGASTDANDNGIPDECETAGDRDGDGDIDLTDFRTFDTCMLGPDGGSQPECTALDMDASGDIDLVDFAAFQQAFTGSTT